jgi:hypothetical protein
MSQSREYFLQFFPALPRSPGMKFTRGCFVISDVLVRAVTGRLAKTVCTWGRPVDRMFVLVPLPTGKAAIAYELTGNAPLGI